jgi:hypothetical protein
LPADSCESPVSETRVQHSTATRVQQISSDESASLNQPIQTRSYRDDRLPPRATAPSFHEFP